MSQEMLKPERPHWLYRLTFVLFPGVLGGLGFVFGPLFTQGGETYGRYEYLDDSLRWCGVGLLLGLGLYGVFYSIVSRTTRPEPGEAGMPVDRRESDYLADH